MQILEFSSGVGGGGGGSSPSGISTILFQGSRGGPTFSEGGGGSRVHLLILYRKPYNL